MSGLPSPERRSNTITIECAATTSSVAAFRLHHASCQSTRVAPRPRAGRSHRPAVRSAPETSHRPRVTEVGGPRGRADDITQRETTSRSLSHASVSIRFLAWGGGIASAVDAGVAAGKSPPRLRSTAPLPHAPYRASTSGRQRAVSNPARSSGTLAVISPATLSRFQAGDALRATRRSRSRRAAASANGPSPSRRSRSSTTASTTRRPFNFRATRTSPTSPITASSSTPFPSGWSLDSIQCTVPDNQTTTNLGTGPP